MNRVWILLRKNKRKKVVSLDQGMRSQQVWACKKVLNSEKELLYLSHTAACLKLFKQGKVLWKFCCLYYTLEFDSTVFHSFATHVLHFQKHQCLTFLLSCPIIFQIKTNTLDAKKMSNPPFFLQTNLQVLKNVRCLPKIKCPFATIRINP